MLDAELIELGLDDIAGDGCWQDEDHERQHRERDGGPDAEASCQAPPAIPFLRLGRFRCALHDTHPALFWFPAPVCARRLFK